MFDLEQYKKWRRQNVTLRGMKSVGEHNEVYGSFGKGLYTVPLSNKKMAKEYGDVYFVVNGKPKHPKVTQTLNTAEIFIQNEIIAKFCIKNKREYQYDYKFFYANTTIEQEMIKLGFDGLIISGREMVNYAPPLDVQYFKTEKELANYYYHLILNK